MSSSTICKDLIYDVGVHNGDDTAYYLSRGYRVVAVDANPAMIAAVSERFPGESKSGKLTLVNAGILDQAGTLPFYVNDKESILSSFDLKLAACHGDPCRTVEMECFPLPVLFAKYGVPYYLKVDIEGADSLCARSLHGATVVPPYASFEFMASGAESIMASLCGLGYQRFKLIYGATFTQSEPIFRHEFGIRLLRKLRRGVPAFRKFLDNAPESMRPAKVEFDTFRDRFPYPFPMGSTGPFGEETHGAWHTAADVRAAFAHARQGAARDPEANLWYDIHAAL